MSDNPSNANEPSLAEELAKYKKAYEEEWERTNLLSTTDGVAMLDTAELRKQTQVLLLKAVPQAVERICAIMQHSDKDSTQLAASRYIIDTVLGKNSSLKVDDDPLDALLDALRANDPVD